MYVLQDLHLVEGRKNGSGGKLMPGLGRVRDNPLVDVVLSTAYTVESGSCRRCNDGRLANPKN